MQIKHMTAQIVFERGERLTLKSVAMIGLSWAWFISIEHFVDCTLHNLTYQQHIEVSMDS